MTTLEQIRKDQLTARKNRDKFKTGILTTLIGEIVTVGKNNGNRETTEEEAIKVITKFKKNANEIVELLDIGDESYKVMAEVEIYDQYLPKQMTGEILREIVQRWKDENYPDTPNIGGCMRALKRCYDGQYDGKMASQIIREIYG